MALLMHITLVQSIQQMQMLENTQFDVDDPMDEPHGPVRLPFFRKGTQICTYVLIGATRG